MRLPSTYFISQRLNVAILVMFLSNYLRCQRFKRKMKMPNCVLENIFKKQGSLYFSLSIAKNISLSLYILKHEKCYRINLFLYFFGGSRAVATY